MSDRHASSSYPLRMPLELRERLEECAGAGKRSLNAELVERLQATLEIDQAMEIGHADAGFRYAASALVSLEDEIREKDEELKGYMQSGYADQMESLLKRIRDQQQETRLLLSAIALLLVKDDERAGQELAAFARSVLRDSPEASEVQFPQGVHAFKEIVKVLKMRALEDDLGL